MMRDRNSAWLADLEALAAANARIAALESEREAWTVAAADLTERLEDLTAQNAALAAALTEWVAAVDQHQEAWDGDSSDEKAWHHGLNQAEMRRQLAEDGLRRALLAQHREPSTDHQ